jgi:hypothetical protein
MAAASGGQMASNNSMSSSNAMSGNNAMSSGNAMAASGTHSKTHCKHATTGQMNNSMSGAAH